MTAHLMCCWPIIAACWLSPNSDSGSYDVSPADTPSASVSYLHAMSFLDANNDRRIDKRELSAGQQTAAVLLMLSWNDCDRDRDGSISRDELERAASTAAQTMTEPQSEATAEVEQQAEADLAQAVPLAVLLDRLAANERYAAEIAALRSAVENLDDDEAVYTYIDAHPALYPHLLPAVRTWVRYCPVRPALRPYAKPAPRLRPLPPVNRPVPPRAGEPAHKPPQPAPHGKAVKPAGPPAHNAGPKPPPGGRR